MRTIIQLIALFIAALVLGTTSAWYMIERGSFLTTKRVGPWSSWVSEGNPNADLYTKAHLARSGRIPMTSTSARYFTARTDSDGYVLTSSCEYLLQGSALNARWWSIAVYDEHGSVLENASERYSFNSDELLRRNDGTYRVSLAANARPENWLPSGSGPAHDIVLMLRVYGPRETDSEGVGDIPDDRLPKIERLSCD